MPGRARAEGDRDRRRRAPAARDRRPLRARRCRTSSSCARGIPAVTDEELARIDGVRRARTASRSSRRASRRSTGVEPERPFAFEHDGVLLRGRLDVLWREGTRALVLDYKTNTLAEGTPEEIIEADYRLQRLVYALACFRAGADEVEVVYHFLERPDAVVTTTFERLELPGARSGAVGGDRADQRGRVHADAERVQLLRLPGARPRVRRAAARRRRVAAAEHPRRGRLVRPSASTSLCGPQLPRRSAAQEGRAEEGADPADHRPARDRACGREDRAHVREPARAADLRDALRADDRREREPRHREALRQVQEAGGLPRRSRSPSSSATSSRRASTARRRSRCAARCSGSSRCTAARCRRELRRAAEAARRRAQDGERRLRRARQRARDRRRHARAPALAATRR